MSIIPRLDSSVDSVLRLRRNELTRSFLLSRMNNYAYTAQEAHYYGKKVFDLVQKGVLKPHVHKEYPFTTEGAQQAQRDLTSGVSTGKLVIKVTDE